MAAKSNPFTEYRILPERKAYALRRKMLRRLLKASSKSAVVRTAVQPVRKPDRG